jgi:hypothetical protein
MHDFSSSAERREAELAAVKAQRAAATAERDRCKRLESAWQRAFRFDARSFWDLARELADHGQLAYLGPIAESRRAVLDGGDVLAAAELAVLELLRKAAEPTSELEADLATARELWPDTLADALDAVRNFVAVRHQHGGELPPEPKPVPKPKPAAVAVAGSKPVAARNAWFLSQYEAKGTDTYHKPVKVWVKWDAMSQQQRATISPESPNKIAKATVANAIKRARAERDGIATKRKWTVKRKRTEKTRRG